MGNIIKKFFQRPRPEQMLIIYTFSLLGFVRLIIFFIPFKYIAGYLGEQMRESQAAEPDNPYAERTGQVIDQVSRHTPWESKCLVQAITGKMLLRRKGLSNTLYLGVAKNVDSKMIAHAWLRYGAKVVTGECRREDFTVVAKFADFGGGMNK